eukprot:6890891-Heterocapsa_arctica.AAC.1
MWGFQPSALSWNTSELNASRLDPDAFLRDIRQRLERLRNETATWIRQLDGPQHNGTLAGRLRYFVDQMQNRTLTDIDAD